MKQKQNILAEKLADLQETMERENIKLSPEMSAYLKKHVEPVQGKLLRGEPVYPKDMEFIEEVKTWLENEKFIQKDMTKSYDEMADTLDNYGYADKRPDKETVLKAIRDLGPEMIERIRKFNRPTIIMTPKGDLASKIQKLDANKKYTDANGQQDETDFQEPPSDALWGPNTTNFSVSIVDGVPEMPKLPADKVDLTNNKKHKYLCEEYKKLGIKMISAREYAMLAQKSLRAYEKGGQNKDEIIDKNNYTYLNADHLTNLKKVPYARWFSVIRGFDFRWDGPAFRDDLAHGRPSVLVL